VRHLIGQQQRVPCTFNTRHTYHTIQPPNKSPQAGGWGEGGIGTNTQSSSLYTPSTINQSHPFPVSFGERGAGRGVWMTKHPAPHTHARTHPRKQENGVSDLYQRGGGTDTVCVPTRHPRGSCGDARCA